MEFEALLEARRSVRAFDETKAVTEDQIKTLIEAGIQAPSWKNSQTARYYCILSDDIKAKFAADCLPEFNAKSSHGAALIVTTFVSNRSGFDREGNPDNECGNGWGYYDMISDSTMKTLYLKQKSLDSILLSWVYVTEKQSASS